MTAGSVLRPDTPETVLEIIRWAASEEAPLEIVGHGSRRGMGRPVQAGHTLDLAALSGVTLYDPEELVLSARAGTSIVEIEGMLRERDQMLAFEPMDCGPIFGAAHGRGTIGGALAANASGPRRIKAGAARDHVLGIRAVSGRGEAFKSGGRVVKNVTGYDLSKGLAGSWGTLAVLTEVTFKVLPAAETLATLVIAGLDDVAAVAALCRAMGSPGEVSAAAHLPAALAGDVEDLGSALAGRAATLIRVEGFAPSVAYRAEKLKAVFAPLGEVAVLDEIASAAVWRAIRDVSVFAARPHPLWRVSVAPTAGPKIVELVGARHAIRHFYDWSGGLVWIEAAEEAEDGLATAIRAAVAANGGGHATLVRGSPVLRNVVPPFEPQPEALAALSLRLKAQFDPRGILNPGRMMAGS